MVHLPTTTMGFNFVDFHQLWLFEVFTSFCVPPSFVGISWHWVGREPSLFVGSNCHFSNRFLHWIQFCTTQWKNLLSRIGWWIYITRADFCPTWPGVEIHRWTSKAFWWWKVNVTTVTGHLIKRMAGGRLLTIQQAVTIHSALVATGIKAFWHTVTRY